MRDMDDNDDDDGCPNCGRISWAGIDLTSDIAECTHCGYQKEVPRGDLTGITWLGPIR